MGKKKILRILSLSLLLTFISSLMGLAIKGRVEQIKTATSLREEFCSLLKEREELITKVITVVERDLNHKKKLLDMREEIRRYKEEIEKERLGSMLVEELEAEIEELISSIESLKISNEKLRERIVFKR